MNIPLVQILPACKNPFYWEKEFSTLLPQYRIKTIPQTAAFIAQTAHESAEFSILAENLNYSAEGLLKVFKKYFPTAEIARMYARKPQAIANRVYADRMGNGPEESGDGWKFRGRGLIQVTGKNNYTRCSSFIFNNMTLLDRPDFLSEPHYALQSALWFWTVNKLAEVEDFELLTKKINGGLNGLAHRLEIYNRALKVLESNNA